VSSGIPVIVVVDSINHKFLFFCFHLYCWWK